MGKNQKSAYTDIKGISHKRHVERCQQLPARPQPAAAAQRPARRAGRRPNKANAPQKAKGPAARAPTYSASAPRGPRPTLSTQVVATQEKERARIKAQHTTQPPTHHASYATRTTPSARHFDAVRHPRVTSTRHERTSTPPTRHSNTPGETRKPEAGTLSLTHHHTVPIHIHVSGAVV